MNIFKLQEELSSIEELKGHSIESVFCQLEKVNEVLYHAAYRLIIRDCSLKPYTLFIRFTKEFLEDDFATVESVVAINIKRSYQKLKSKKGSL